MYPNLKYYLTAAVFFAVVILGCCVALWWMSKRFRTRRVWRVGFPLFFLLGAFANLCRCVIYRVSWQWGGTSVLIVFTGFSWAISMILCLWCIGSFLFDKKEDD